MNKIFEITGWFGVGVVIGSLLKGDPSLYVYLLGVLSAIIGFSMSVVITEIDKKL